MLDRHRFIKHPERRCAAILTFAVASVDLALKSPKSLGWTSSENRLSVAVLIPCYNEERTIGKVVREFHHLLPNATIYVYDNNSGDRTADIAREAGATVRHEPLQGKGKVVRRMFADVEADVFILVDGDDTYDPAIAEDLVEHLVQRQLDFVNAKRTGVNQMAYRPGHRFGNRMLTAMVSAVFGKRFDDILSGYKVLSRRFVKSFPALSSGFEIETELAIHALELDMPLGELPTAYKERASGSASKLRTIRDGLRILKTIGVLIKEERPLSFFTASSSLLVVAAGLLVWPVIRTYLETGLVPRLPTAILSTALMLLAFLSLACGLILDTVTRGRREMKRLFYLSYSSPASITGSDQRSASQPVES